MKKTNFKWLLGLVYFGLILVFLIFQGEENLVINLTFYLIAPLTSLAAGIITLRRLGWVGKRAMVLKFLLAALALWFLGEFMTLYYAWKGVSPYPSLGDVFFIAGYALFSTAVIFEARLFNLNLKKINPRLLSALGIILALLVILVSYFGVIGYKQEESLLVNLTTLSWSVGDLVMGGLGLILLAMVWEYRGGSVKREWLWFICAVFVTLLPADIIYNLNPEAINSGSSLNLFLNSMWVGAYFLFAGYFLEMNDELKRIQTKNKDLGKNPIKS